MHLRGQRFGPRCVVVVATAGDEHWSRAAGRLQEVRILLVEIDVVVGCHVAAAAPRLVADREICNLPGLRMTVARALRGERRRLVRGHVLEPLRHLVRRARAEIGVDIGVCADQFREVQEFMRAEFVGLGHAAPVRVQGHRTLRARRRCRRASGIRRRSSRPASAPPAHAARASAATTSLRNPRVFGIFDFGPTQTPS